MPRCTTTSVVPREGDLLVPGSLGYLTHILAGRRRLRPEHAQRIAEALGVPVSYILPANLEPQEAGV